MATPRGQRIGIWIIAVALIVGTLGSFAAMVLSSQNGNKDQERYKQLEAEYNKQMTEYQAKVTAQADELSSKYYPTFSQYAGRVAAFDLDSNNKTLQSEDLVVGEGEEITGETKFAAYYIGWDAKAKIFDQSVSDGKLKSPLPISEGLDQASLIEGWKEGMKGMKIGGVRELTIPSDKAYKDKGSQDQSGKEVIAPNMPLKFMVMAVAPPAEIAQPVVSEELKALYAQLYGLAQ